jgi:hypothetical protein
MLTALKVKISLVLSEEFLSLVCYYAFPAPGGLLSTAQSYPSLTTSGPTGTGSGGISTTAGNGPCLSQALTMSLTSTSSDSEQVSSTRVSVGVEIYSR